jgi:uncharacterized protein YjbI with pentapeptide repeats
LDRSDASALADLQMHWDEAYVIGLDGDIWSARFRDSTDELRAHSSTELRELIRADYSYRAKVRPTDDDLGEEDLSDAGVSDADMSDADMSDADMSDADMSDADMSDADASDADASERDASDEDEDGTLPQQPEDVSFAAIRGERMST